ncbi:uncharacterized protein LOC130049636 [Ostrea edulis]|uniref:uncharacterized protein LOC130049636 n=1 Tax=Ostrea edulis TaxID=37623 RepID=UPI0024AEC3DE|nr:uncharacterized protein LOC130049636 [Ostrea edulis]
MFRLSRPTFDTVKGFLQNCPELGVEGNRGREPISVEKQLYVTLWYLGGSDSIIRIADRFGIAESSVIVCRNRIIDTILNNFKSKFIIWPHAEVLEQTIDKFHQRNGFPGIIGALEGTHISIKAPTENPQSYVNRKGYHSLQLQAVCDSDMKVVIERAFELLKGRFRRLHHLDVLSIPTAVKIIMSLVFCTISVLFKMRILTTIWNHWKLINNQYLNWLFRKMRRRALLNATFFTEDSVDIRYYAQETFSS